MNSVFPGQDALPDRGRLTQAVRDALRHLSTQLSLLTHRVGGRLELRGTDLECLDLIDTCGPIGPSELARRTGLHPATMTGIIDRLERGGWITRDRDPHDRRAVVVQVVRSRGQDLLRMFAGMNAALTQISAGYTDAELDVIARFLTQTADAARAAAEDLPTSPLPDPLVYPPHLGAAAGIPGCPPNSRQSGPTCRTLPVRHGRTRPPPCRGSLARPARPAA
jgi:DNA-binding MarR family transcriptional regulator